MTMPFDSAVSLLGIYSKEMKTLTQRDGCVPMLPATLFIIATAEKRPEGPPTDE